jgi:hypothetical protein
LEKYKVGDWVELKLTPMIGHIEKIGESSLFIEWYTQGRIIGVLEYLLVNTTSELLRNLSEEDVLILKLQGKL